jgi:(2R)-sulfolactate sulfo-lyase subunit beta
VVPVLKLTANPHTARTMSEHIDLDVSEVITADMSLDEAATLTEDLVVQTASGRWAAAEALGHREFVLTRLHRTA